MCVCASAWIYVMLLTGTKFLTSKQHLNLGWLYGGAFNRYSGRIAEW